MSISSIRQWCYPTPSARCNVTWRQVGVQMSQDFVQIFNMPGMDQLGRMAPRSLSYLYQHSPAQYHNAALVSSCLLPTSPLHGWRQPWLIFFTTIPLIWDKIVTTLWIPIQQDSSLTCIKCNSRSSLRIQDVIQCCCVHLYSPFLPFFWNLMAFCYRIYICVCYFAFWFSKVAFSFEKWIRSQVIFKKRTD